MPERFHDMDKSRAPRALDYAMVLCAVTIWGGSFAATKYALAQAEPSLILCLRLAMTLPVLAAGCALGRELRLPTAHEAFVLALLGFQGICFHQGIQAVAMKTAGAGNANWMMVASPAVVTVLGWLFLKAIISRGAVAGLALASAGVALVLAAGTVKETAESVSFGSWGDFLMLASVLNWGVFLVISRKLLKSTMTPAFSIFWELVFAAFFAFLATLIFGTDYSVIPGFTAGTWLSITMKINYFVFIKKPERELPAGAATGRVPESASPDRMTASVATGHVPACKVLAMAAATVLVVITGIRPEICYDMLSMDPSHLFAADHVLEYIGLFAGATVPFVLLRTFMAPHEGINLDVDRFYRITLYRGVFALSDVVHLFFAKYAVIFDNFYRSVGDALRSPGRVFGLRITDSKEENARSIGEMVHVLAILCVIALITILVMD